MKAANSGFSSPTDGSPMPRPSTAGVPAKLNRRCGGRVGGRAFRRFVYGRMALARSIASGRSFWNNYADIGSPNCCSKAATAAAVPGGRTCSQWRPRAARANRGNSLAVASSTRSVALRGRTHKPRRRPTRARR
jgi:hypothetical protein